MPIDKKITRDSLVNLPLFSELNVEELRLVTSISKIQQVKKSQTIFNEGDVYKGFFIVLKGSIKVSKFSPEGKEIVLHLIKPFDAFGDVPLFEGGNYPVTAVTLADSELLFIPKKEFLLLLSKCPNLSLRMLAGFAKRMRMLTKKVEELTTKEITGRLAVYLIEEIKRTGVDKLPEPCVKLAIPKKNIAAYLGTITETLSRTFKKLQDDNIIRVSGKKIFIKNLEKLKKISS